MPHHPLTANSQQPTAFSYHLFGRLFLEGLTPALLPAVMKVPALGEGVPEPFEADEAAADYQHLFGFNVFPYAALFLDPEGMLGGPISESVRNTFQQTGFQVDLSREPADHIGHELALMAFLTQAEAEAREDHLPAEAERMRGLLRHFMDEHLLGWLPALVQALRAQEMPFYSALADQTLDLVLAHRQTLGESTPGTPFTLTPPPDLLSEQKTGLKDIAEYLTTPPWSGFYLSRQDINRLGRSQNLPHGFGNRSLMLGNLLRSAAAYEQVDPLLERLTALIDTWRSHYTALLETQTSGLNDLCSLWIERLNHTERLLATIQDSITP